MSSDENLGEKMNDMVANQYLNHKDRFSGWIKKMMKKEPTPQTPPSEGQSDD